MTVGGFGLVPGFAKADPRGPRGRGGVAADRGSEVGDFFGDRVSGGTKTGTAWPLAGAKAEPLGWPVRNCCDRHQCMRTKGEVS
jgi:hypothetical protein